MAESPPAQNDSGEECVPMPMPVPEKKSRKKHKSLAFEKVYISNLPNAEMYEKSYMHRDVITHVAVASETQFIVTASRDGHVKFWKKMSEGIEFVKHYKAHLNEILGLAISVDGLRLCTTSSDQNVKFYDIVGFDMVNMIKVGYVPNVCCWVYDGMDAKVAVSDKNGNWIRIYKADQVGHDPLHTIEKLHTAPVNVLGYNAAKNIAISCDLRGHIEYWNSETYAFPNDSVEFRMKSDTDLYALAKDRTYATSVAIDRGGNTLALTARNGQIYVFRFSTGRLRRKYDESPAVFEDAFADKTIHLDALDFGRRMAVEKEINASSDVVMNCVFDDSGHFLLYATLLGIKIVNIETNKLVKLLGKVENTDRFLQIALFQEKPRVNTQFEKHLRSSTNSDRKQDPIIMTDETDRVELADPTLFCTSFRKNRFYLFSSREPEDEDSDGNFGRDVLNEKPAFDESQGINDSNASKITGDTVILHTTVGDITIKLFAKECPKTVENFCTHARSGYYDDNLFHRVIKNFMIQTGDPVGDGTGGESIWGGEFKDELNRNLRHDRGFTVSMANAGPNTNGSQFFITTVPTPWLDNKHTVFGRVEHGKDTVMEIEQTRTDKFDRPMKEIKIINIDVF